MSIVSTNTMLTPGRRQSKVLLTIDEHGSKIDKNSVFNCHFSPVGPQMAIKNSVSNNFLSKLVASINSFDCRLPGVMLVFLCRQVDFVARLQPFEHWVGCQDA